VFDELQILKKVRQTVQPHTLPLSFSPCAFDFVHTLKITSYFNIHIAISNTPVFIQLKVVYSTSYIALQLFVHLLKLIVQATGGSINEFYFITIQYAGPYTKYYFFSNHSANLKR
jgi:hypothetical protein